MPWNGSGVFTRIYSWVADKNAGIDITASRMDTDTNDITANGFGNCITRDGQGSASTNLPMNGFKFTGLGAGSTAGDSLRYEQLFVSPLVLTGDLTIGSTATSAAKFTIRPISTAKAWQVSANQFTSNALEFTPSTAAGNTTFTTPAFYLTPTGATFPSTVTVNGPDAGTWTSAGIAGLVKLATSSSATLQANFNSTNVQGPYAAWQRSGTDNGYVGSAASLFGGSINDFGIGSAGPAHNLVLGANTIAVLTLTPLGDMTVGTSTSTTHTFNFRNGGNFIQIENAGAPYGYIGNGSGLVTGGSSSNFVISAQSIIQFVAGNNGVAIGKMDTANFAWGVGGTAGTSIEIVINGGSGAGGGPGIVLQSNSVSNAFIGTEAFVLGSGTSVNTSIFNISNFIRLYPAGGLAMSLESSSIIKFPSIATSSAGANAVLDAATGQLARSTSSMRYKTDPQSLTADRRDLILKFNPVTYLSTIKGEDPTLRHYGFIAEEVAAIDPMLISYIKLPTDQKDDHGNAILADPVPDGVFYDRLTVMLTAKAQDHESRLGIAEVSLVSLQAAYDTYVAAHP